MKIRILLSLLGCSMFGLAQPTLVSLSPLNGTGSSATYTSVYRHPGGVDKTYLAYLLILPTPNVVQFVATGSCLVEYNRISRGVRLIDNPGTGWLGPITGVPIGLGGSLLQNNFCSVNTSLITATLAGTDLTVRVPVTFKPGFSGPMGTFLQLADVNDNWTGMNQFGNWTPFAISTPKPGPFVRSIQVARNGLFPSKLDVFSGHTSGLPSLSMINVLVAEKIVGGTHRCHIIYFAGTKEIKLVNDAGTDFINGNPPFNNTCAIGNLSGDIMFASGQGNEVHLHIPMLFNPDITTPLNVWVNTFDTTGKLTHWMAP